MNGLDAKQPAGDTISPGVFLRRYGTLIGFLLIVLFFWTQRPQTFMTAPNWINITRQMSILGVVAFTSTIVMVTGDFDLSIGALASLVGIVAGTVFQGGGTVAEAVALGLLVGVAGGVLNGMLVAYVGISAFVATLGTLTAFRGLALYISGGASIYGRAIPAEFSSFGRGAIPLGAGGGLALPNLTILALLIFFFVFVFLNYTVAGRRLYAIGGNMEAARFGGVRISRLRLLSFVISGLGAAVAGLMLFSRLSTAHPTQGEGLMLQAIAAVFLGMTLSEESQPNVGGTLIGVLILGVLANGLTQMQIDTYIQQISTGVIIILAVTLSSVSQQRRAYGRWLRRFFRRQPPGRG